MKIKTSELIDQSLDWAVAKAEGYIDQDHRYPNGATCKVGYLDGPHGVILMTTGDWFRPSTIWNQGGPIIEREKISFWFDPDEGWWACANLPFDEAPAPKGPTPLIAAMRCFVASKLGDNIDIPEELL